MITYNTIILGSSPNALTAAAYLAKAGKQVLVLEPTEYIGGVTATTEFANGFRADIGLTSGRLDSSIARDLQVEDHGLVPIERNSITSLLPDQQSFTLSSDRAMAVDAIRRFAPNDAERYLPFMQLLDLASDLLRSAYSMVPPAAHHPDSRELAQLMSLVAQMRGFGRREMTEVMRLLVMSARDLLDEWFEHPALKGLLASTAIRGLTQGPFSGGTTFNLLHHQAIGDGYFRSTARGGLGAISQALATAAQAYGATIRTSSGALRVLVADGIASGVRLASGEEISASRIISDYDARHTFTQLVAPPELEPEFNRAVQHIHYNGSVAHINLALRELPRFVGLDTSALQGTLVIAPSLAYLERAFDNAKYGQLSEQPYLEASIPSLADPSLAPAGQHVLSIWVQYVPYRGKIAAERVLEVALNQLSNYAPNLRGLVIASQVRTPADYATQFDLSEGHLYGGEMTLAQAFFLRPIPGFAQYHTPIGGLDLCGAATHPGGGISGLAGKHMWRDS